MHGAREALLEGHLVAGAARVLCAAQGHVLQDADHIVRGFEVPLHEAGKGREGDGPMNIKEKHQGPGREGGNAQQQKETTTIRNSWASTG